MREVRASAPGKVNLLLKVGQPTSDGYHPLVTVFETLNIREYVTVRTSRTPGIRVTTTAYLPDGSIDADTTAELAQLSPENHLAVRAAKTLQPLAAMGPWKTTSAGLTIHVDKHIPTAGGMAGGSADAAATLLACNELWELGLNTEQLETLGRTLGADVPACIHGGISLGLNRGDHLTSLPTPDHPHDWVMAIAHTGLSTPEVFSTFDVLHDAKTWPELPQLGDNPTQHPAIAPFSQDTCTMAGALDNDLSVPALHLRPELADTLAAGQESGALAALLSGSGPTCAFLAQNAEHAQAIWNELVHHPHVKTCVITSGPAQPARIETIDTM